MYKSMDRFNRGVYAYISYVCKISVHTHPLRVNLTACILHLPAVKAFLPLKSCFCIGIAHLTQLKIVSCAWCLWDGFSHGWKYVKKGCNLWEGLRSYQIWWGEGRGGGGGV